jgi:DNA-binding transcriptional ArsR family regulator
VVRGFCGLCRRLCATGWATRPAAAYAWLSHQHFCISGNPQPEERWYPRRSEARLDDVLEVCKALANPTCRQILGWLRDPTEHFAAQLDPMEEVGVCVKQIQEKAEISQSTASRFMSVLQRAGLVQSRRVGQWTYYRRDDTRIAAISAFLSGVLQQRGRT